MSILEENTSSHSKIDAKIAALDNLSKELSFPVNFSASSEVLRQFLVSAYHDNSPAIVGKTISVITVFLAQLTRNEEDLSAGVRNYLFQVSTVRKRYIEECVTIFRRLFELSGNETQKFLVLHLTESPNQNIWEFALELVKRLFSRLPEGWSIESYRKSIITALINTWQNKDRPVMLRKQSLELFVNLFMIYSFRIIPEMPPIASRILKRQLIDVLKEKGASLNLIDEIKQMQFLFEYGVESEEGEKEKPVIKEMANNIQVVVKNVQASGDLKFEDQSQNTPSTRSKTFKQENEPRKLFISCKQRKIEENKQKVITEDSIIQEQNTLNSLITKLDSFKTLSRRDQTAIPYILEIILQNQIQEETQEQQKQNKHSQKSKPLLWQASFDTLISHIIPLISSFYTITIPSSYAATTNIVKYLIKLLPRHSIHQTTDLEQKGKYQINNAFLFYEEHLENIMISAERASSTCSQSLRLSVISLFHLIFELFPEFGLKVILKILTTQSSSALEISLRILSKFLFSGYFKERLVQLKMILEIFSTLASSKDSSQFIRSSALNFLCMIAQISGEGLLTPYLNKLSIPQMRQFQQNIQCAREEQFKKNKKMSEQENAKAKEITAMLQTDKQIYDLERLILKNSKPTQENSIPQNSSSQMKKSDNRIDEFVDMIRKQIEFHRCGSRRNEWWIDYVEVFQYLLDSKTTSTRSLLLLSALVSSFSCAQLLKLFNIVIEFSERSDSNQNKSILATRFISECFRIRGVSLFYSQFQSIWSKCNLNMWCRDQGPVVLIQALTISYSSIEQYLVEELSSQMIKILCQDQYRINNAIYIFLATADLKHEELFLEKLADALYFHPPHLLKKVRAEKHKALCIMELRNLSKQGTQVENIAQYDLFNESHSESDNQHIMDFVDDHESTKSIADNYSFIEDGDEI